MIDAELVPDAPIVQVPPQVIDVEQVSVVEQSLQRVVDFGADTTIALWRIFAGQG